MLPLSAFESPNETLNMVAPRGYSRSLALAAARCLIGGRDKWFPYQDERWSSPEEITPFTEYELNELLTE